MSVYAVPATAGTARSGPALDALNFFLADVHGGLGPYLAIYLLTVGQWNEAQIGAVMSVAGIAGVLAQTPAGALVDATHAKRVLVVAAAAIVSLASIALLYAWGFLAVAASQAVVGSAGAVFGPAIAAISLGIVGLPKLAHRIGRNEAFNHAGNAVTASIAGFAGYVWGPVAVFVLLAVMAIASIASTLCIPARAIDHDRARGLVDGETHDADAPSGLLVVLTCRPLLVFAGCAILFHLANAAMLPLVGQKLALSNRNEATALMSGCIVAAQLVMIPMAVLVGRKADVWGRKGLFLAGFAILTLRGLLYPLSNNPFWLLGVQTLDGVGAGLYGALFPLIVADLTRGTGRFNVSQGAISSAQGIGASLSTAIAGVIVVTGGYSAAFLSLAAIAACGFVVFWWAMPETGEANTA
ncbi:MAG TPA: MFS transporter [Stellaceae bacterium]|jgi:MFS family permease|nr:MFS transporter [Stellaceae bacterium]